MNRLDQGHLHPKLPKTDMSRPGIKAGPPWWKVRKELSKQLVNSYSENLHMNAQPLENALDMAPPSACVT